MTYPTIKTEIMDILPTLVEEGQEQLKELFEEYVDSNYEGESIDTNDVGIDELNHDGSFDNLVDGLVPIYDSELLDTFYLYNTELEDSLYDALGESLTLENTGAAIYYYLFSQLSEIYEDSIEDWVGEHNEEVAEEEEE